MVSKPFVANDPWLKRSGREREREREREGERKRQSLDLRTIISKPIIHFLVQFSNFFCRESLKIKN